MSGVIERLRAESLKARRDRGVMAGFLSFVLAEIEKVGKNKGNRPTTEEEAIGVIQKQINVGRENLKVVTDPANVQKIEAEIDVLERVLPTMASDDEIWMVVNQFAEENPEAKIGQFMGTLREKFGANVDMKRANQIVQQKLANT